MCPSYPQRFCLECPQINNWEAVKNSCKCSRGTICTDPGCGYFDFFLFARIRLWLFWWHLLVWKVVCTLEFPCFDDHHFCTGMIVSYSDISVLALTDIFRVKIRWIERLSYFIILNRLSHCRTRITLNFLLFLIITDHDNQTGRESL